jgi:G3E family GTPase
VPAPARVPVHILTGFLGSGKTTLLNRALVAGFGADTAIVVNELGDVGLDGIFIQTRSSETIVMKSGCVCCTLRGDLPATLLALAAERDRTGAPLARIVIETSGISEPLPILLTLRSDAALAARFRAGAIVCTVSALAAGEVGRSGAARAQASAADAFVVTQRDLAAPDAADAAQQAAIGVNPLAQIVAATGVAFAAWLRTVESDDCADARVARMVALSCDAAAPVHDVRSIVIRAPAPPSWSQFAVWLTRLVFVHGDRILRTKGVLYDPGRNAWIGIHGVKRYFHPPVHLAPPVEPLDGTCLVFITEGLDPQRIADSYHRSVGAAPPV